MTKREAEIVNIIKINPLITQLELAEALGIERSSVAVHISNLIKKGIIKGKGYIIDNEPFLVVIGGSNMDILGKPSATLVLEDSNPGIISTSPGGVARNIAENMGLLGLNVKLLSAVGNDANGALIQEKTQLSGVDVHYLKKTTHSPTSVYLSLLDETGNMKVALSDMAITEEIDIAYITENEALIKSASFVVIDTNLTEDVLLYLTGNFPQVKFIVDTVSTTKALKVKDLLSHIYVLKVNKLEAGVLYGQVITTDAEIKDALLFFHQTGVTYPIMTLGKEGVAYLVGQKLNIIKHTNLSVKNANGAGDAFTAGMAYGFYHQFSLDKIITYASGTAGFALECESTVNPTLTEKRLYERIHANNHNEK